MFKYLWAIALVAGFFVEAASVEAFSSTKAEANSAAEGSAFIYTVEDNQGIDFHTITGKAATYIYFHLKVSASLEKNEDGRYWLKRGELYECRQYLGSDERNPQISYECIFDNIDYKTGSLK